MKKVTLQMPVLASVAVTRGMLGAGVALLLGDRLSRRQKRNAGWILFLTGAISTAPLLWAVLGDGTREAGEKGEGRRAARLISGCK